MAGGSATSPQFTVEKGAASLPQFRSVEEGRGKPPVLATPETEMKMRSGKSFLNILDDQKIDNLSHLYELSDPDNLENLEPATLGVLDEPSLLDDSTVYIMHPAGESSSINQNSNKLKYEAMCSKLGFEKFPEEIMKAEITEKSVATKKLEKNRRAENKTIPPSVKKSKGKNYITSLA